MFMFAVAMAAIHTSYLLRIYVSLFLCYVISIFRVSVHIS